MNAFKLTYGDINLSIKSIPIFTIAQLIGLVGMFHEISISDIGSCIYAAIISVYRMLYNVLHTGIKKTDRLKKFRKM